MGAIVLFTCDDGYKLEGSTERTCEGNGEWSGNDTKCVRTYYITLSLVNLATFTRCCANVVPTRRRWANINLTSCQSLIFTGAVTEVPCHTESLKVGCEETFLKREYQTEAHKLWHDRHICQMELDFCQLDAYIYRLLSKY